MANIRIDLNHAPLDGETVSFKAPCNASDITGLVVYHPDENGREVSQEFTLNDANGNDIGSIDNIFAEGAIVKVILDTDLNNAFVQNPDTNAYLEGRFDALDAKIENKKGAVTYTATIGTSWTENEDTGVKTQTVSISGVTASHTAKVDHYYNGNGTSDAYATFVEEENQYLTFITNGYAETYDGGITFHIFGEPNTVNIPIVVEVV